MVVNSALVTALLMSGLAAAGAGAVAVGAAALAAVFAFGAAVAALSAAFGLVAGGVALPSAGGVVVAAADEPVALAGCSLPVTAPLGAVADADSLLVPGVAGAVGAVGSVGDTGVSVTVSGVFFVKLRANTDWPCRARKPNSLLRRFRRVEPVGSAPI